MAVSSSKFQYYSNLHNDFSESYPVINKYVLSLYASPRKFIIETSPVLDRFIRHSAVPGAPSSSSFNSRAVLEFISQVDEFTRQAIVLFEQHKHHVDACSHYMQQVDELRIKHSGKQVTQTVFDYLQLLPLLLSLHTDLLAIKDRADELILRLKKLELRWDILKPTLN